MNEKFTTIGLLFLIVLIGGKELNQQLEPQPADTTPSDIVEIGNPLKPTRAEVVESKSAAQAVAAAESQGAEMVETNAEDASEPGKFNQRRNYGAAAFANKVVRVWDDNYQLWRDVRVGDYEWTRGADGIYSIDKTKPKWSVRVGDQYAEAVLFRYCKLPLEENPKGIELGRTFWIVVISWLVISFIWDAICLRRIAKKSRTAKLVGMCSDWSALLDFQTSSNVWLVHAVCLRPLHRRSLSHGCLDSSSEVSRDCWRATLSDNCPPSQ
jgi:hypothetical protein